VLTRFRAAVTEIYGERAERVVLFGSRARGDAKPDSDYDIAVFLTDGGTFSDESARSLPSAPIFSTTRAQSSPPRRFRRGPIATAPASCTSCARTVSIYEGRNRRLSREGPCQLADAEKIAALPLPHIAAREAYLAVFHAADFSQTAPPPRSDPKDAHLLAGL
jgi:hypothetical protein